MLRDGQWSGHAVYIVGGGPSLRNFDWGLLQERGRVLVINAAMFDVPWADLFFTEDLRFIEKFHADERWRRFEGVKVFHALVPSYGEAAKRYDPSVVVLGRKRDDKFWARSLEDGLSYSSNSGIGALNLAAILDAKPIYLLGFDCRPRKTGENPNYHDVYPQDWRMPHGQEESYRSDFEHWAAHWLRDRRVINLVDPSHPSAIACWPRMLRDEFLRSGKEVPWKA